MCTRYPEPPSPFCSSALQRQPWPWGQAFFRWQAHFFSSGPVGQGVIQPHAPSDTAARGDNGESDLCCSLNRTVNLAPAFVTGLLSHWRHFSCLQLLWGNSGNWLSGYQFCLKENDVFKAALPLCLQNLLSSVLALGMSSWAFTLTTHDPHLLWTWDSFLFPLAFLLDSEFHVQVT